VASVSATTLTAESGHAAGVADPEGEAVLVVADAVVVGLCVVDVVVDVVADGVEADVVGLVVPDEVDPAEPVVPPPMSLNSHQASATTSTRATSMSTRRSQ
jgi:hypothetical protein